MRLKSNIFGQEIKISKLKYLLFVLSFRKAGIYLMKTPSARTLRMKRKFSLICIRWLTFAADLSFFRLQVVSVAIYPSSHQHMDTVGFLNRPCQRYSPRIPSQSWTSLTALTVRHDSTKDPTFSPQVFVRIKDVEWNIYRRYSHFNILHQALRKKYKIVNTYSFPPKKAIGNRVSVGYLNFFRSSRRLTFGCFQDAKLVEDRRQKLQHYLRCVINYIVQSTGELANNPDKDTLINLMPFFG